MTAGSPDEIPKLRRELEFVRMRENVLLQIDALTRVATDPAEITYTAARLLGLHLHVNRCAYAEVSSKGDNLTVIGDFVDGVRSMVGSYSLRQFFGSAYDLLTAGQPFIVEDAESDPRCAAGIESFRNSGVRSTVSFRS